jgi:hypothetical protein
VQPASGAVREYQGADAERLLKLLRVLCCHGIAGERSVGWWEGARGRRPTPTRMVATSVLAAVFPVCQDLTTVAAAGSMPKVSAIA